MKTNIHKYNKCIRFFNIDAMALPEPNKLLKLIELTQEYHYVRLLDTGDDLYHFAFSNDPFTDDEAKQMYLISAGMNKRIKNHLRNLALLKDI